jgi:hypothetical protein
VIIADAKEKFPEMVFFDGLDDAFIGVARIPGEDYVACYSFMKIKEMMIKDGASHQDADEYIEYNLLGAYVGPGTPLVIEEN